MMILKYKINKKGECQMDNEELLTNKELREKLNNNSTALS